MKIKFIKGEFIVKSEASDKYYTVDRSLRCSCDGFFFNNKCKHQKMVEEYINSGKVADDMRIGVTR